jgi:hypothetical protein
MARAGKPVKIYGLEEREASSTLKPLSDPVDNVSKDL